MTVRQWTGLGLGGLALAIVATLAYQLMSWPDVAALADRNPASTAFIDRYRERLRAAGKPDRVAWRWVPASRISPHLQRAVLAAEDIGFFGHRGFATAEIRVAIREAVESGEAPRGASTITQQLAKNLWLSPSRSPIRKVKEAILTWQMERRLSKQRILELYLNVVEFGPGVYGAEAAARRYFGRAAADLSEHDAARLAAGLPRPSQWNPSSASRSYYRYVGIIEARMAKADFLWKWVGGRPGGDSVARLDSIPVAPLVDSAAMLDTIAVPEPVP